jgi:hypothetical protein
LKGLRQLTRSVFAVIEPRGPGEKSRGCAPPHIAFENLIGIEEVTHDQIETCEVIRQLPWKLGVSGEGSNERHGVERPNGIGVESLFGKSRDGFGTEDFQMRRGETITQQFYRGQGKDEIADGAAANDQDAVQVSNG